MLPELDISKQHWENTFKNISLTPYRLIAAGIGPKHVHLPDGTEVGAYQVKRELNYPGLLAWNSDRKDVIEGVQFLNEHPDSNWDLVIDSGAYSAWSIGKEFDMDEYITFLESNKVLDVAFWAAEADKIPGSFGVDPTEEERLAAPEISWQNYIYMTKRVSWPKKIVPIFHMGEDYKHLVRMLDYKFPDGDFIPYIGISPRNDVNVNEKIDWYEKTWNVIYTECKKIGRDIPLTHNFGCTTVSIMEQYPSCSSDSTSWIRSASFGNVLTVVNGKMKPVCVSGRQITSPDHVYHQPKPIQDVIEKQCQKIGHGYSVKSLVEDEHGTMRHIYNLYSLNEWRQNFKYEGNLEFKEELW